MVFHPRTLSQGIIESILFRRKCVGCDRQDGVRCAAVL